MKKKIVIAGCTGHAEKFGQLVNSFAESEMVAVWDINRERGLSVAEKLSVPFESDYEQMLEKYRPDGVLVICENRYKADLIIKAADRGISVFVEKPMCVRLSEAYAVKQAIYRNNVRFYMTDPFVRSGLLKIQQLIKEGKLGKITEATFRISQQRPNFEKQFSAETSQGGIMADVGGHGIHMAHFLFGKPLQVSSVLTYNTPYAKKEKTEQNACVSMLYPDDLLVTLQCSFVSSGLDNLIMVRGTQATAMVVRLSGQQEGAETVELYTDQFNKTVYTDLPANPTRHIRYFIEMLVNGYPNDIVGKDPLSNSGVSIDNAVEYVQIINAIYESANKGLTEVR